jgi:hypothetical protein
MHAIGGDVATANDAPSLKFRLLVLRRLASGDIAHHARDVLSFNLGRSQSSNQRNDVVLQIAKVLSESRRLLVWSCVFLKIACPQFGDRRN